MEYNLSYVFSFSLKPYNFLSCYPVNNLYLSFFAMVKSQNIIKKQTKKDINDSNLKLFIETDKLHNIKRNIEKFLNKWSENKLSNLQFPYQFEKYRKSFIFLQWTNRFALCGAGILTLNGYQKLGGTISIFFPLVDLLTLTLRDKSEEKKRYWKDFIKDCEKLSNNFDELTNIIKPIRNFSSEILKNPSNKLNDKVYKFLEKYDKNKDRIIEVHELRIDEFAWDLKKNWIKWKEKKLKEVVWEIQNLQKEVIKFQNNKL